MLNDGIEGGASDFGRFSFVLFGLDDYEDLSCLCSISLPHNGVQVKVLELLATTWGRTCLVRLMKAFGRIFGVTSYRLLLFAFYFLLVRTASSVHGSSISEWHHVHMANLLSTSLRTEFRHIAAVLPLRLQISLKHT